MEIRSILVLLFICIWTLTSCQSQPPQPRLFYLVAKAGNSPEYIAENYDLQILHEFDIETAATIRTLDPNDLIFLYKSMIFIHEPANPGDPPNVNQAADEVGDWTYIDTNHPDWFLFAEDGQRIKMPGMEWLPGSYWVMDPGHPGWRAFWKDRVRMDCIQGLWNGVFIDNVWNSRFWIEQKIGKHLRDYPNDNSLQNAVAGFLASVRDPPPGEEAILPMLGNISSNGANSSVWARYLEFMDGAMEEHPFAWAPFVYKPVNEWLDDLAKLANAVQLGKISLTVAQGKHEPGQYPHFRFCLASHLLTASSSGYFWFGSNYLMKNPPIYPEYCLGLGHPVSSFIEQGGIYMRSFSNGIALVNPSANSRGPVSLDQIYYDAYGESYQEVTLPPYSGLILVKSLTIKNNTGVPTN